ncbi:MAG TPA: RDD family protein [Candidatus Dormibacteraeota bacterium]|nr:RDD family protein [Candidatus Dormibacteraeota bacterium]
MQLRRFVPLAPAPGAVLAYVAYALSRAHAFGGYPVDQWAVVAVIAGWCLMLAGLTFLAPSLVPRWMAIAAAVAFLAGPYNPAPIDTALYAAGFVLAAAMILVATTTYVVLHNGARGRIAWAAALAALGAGSAFAENPAAQMWAVLILSPAGVGLGALWLRLDRPSLADVATPGKQASFSRRFLAGFVGWVVFGVVDAWIGSTAPVAAVVAYPVCVVLLQVLPTAIWGRTLGQLSTGLRVVRVDTGGRPGWLRAAMRSVAFQAVPVAGVVYFVMWGLRRAVPARLIWDRASGTAVLRVPRQAVTAQSAVRT